MDIAFLDRYAQKQWESILFYMVGSTAGLANADSFGSSVGEGTKTLLRNGEFVRVGHGRVHITRTGFTFVLQEVNAQVWSLLIVYLKHAPSVSSAFLISQSRHGGIRLIPQNTQLQMSEVDVLSFLFMLGSLELGQDYSTANLSPTQSQMLEDLSAFGIVYRRSKNSSRFYPTRLATSLTSDDMGALSQGTGPITNALQSSSGSAGKGYIIVETNYRLYAYTSSLLQIAVLSLFTKLVSRFPNLVSGKLTKESIRRANELGISASQIIDYLTVHAHPQMQKTTQVLPPTVMDQIRLWEYEGERVECTNGFLMKDFASDGDYRDLVGYAESLGVLVWKNDDRRLLFVERVDQIGLYLNNRKKQG